MSLPRTQKRKIKHIVYSWWTVVTLLFLAFLFATNTWDGYKKYSESRRNVAGLAERLESTKNREGELQAKINYLNSERGLEEEIRDKFNVAKEGEEVVVIVGPEIEKNDDVKKEESLVKGLWSRILDVFR